MTCFVLSTVLHKIFRLLGILFALILQLEICLVLDIALKTYRYRVTLL